MLKKLSLITIAIVLLLSACQNSKASNLPNVLVVATSLATPKGPSLLDRDFEGNNSLFINNGDRGNWEIKEENGNHFLETTTATNTTSLNNLNIEGESWKNYLFEYRFNVTNCNPDTYFGCVTLLFFRTVPSTCYILSINSNTGEISVDYGGDISGNWEKIKTGINETYINLPLNTWHKVLISANGSNLDAFIDDQWVISVTDDHISSGGVAISVGAGVTEQFDDFHARSIPNE
jgi:hypothetical protein